VTHIAVYRANFVLDMLA